MKDQAIQYLAFDVHQATIVATHRDPGGSIVMRATIPTEARAVVRLIRSAGTRVHVAFEEGTQAQWLHDLVAPHAERVIVCNTRGESEGGNKNDRLDADRLSERLRLGSLNLLTLKELVRNYNNLVTRVMQRIKALFRARLPAFRSIAFLSASSGFRACTAVPAFGLALFWRSSTFCSNYDQKLKQP